MNNEFKLFGRLNVLDSCLLVIILLSALGFGMARAGHAGVDKVIKGVEQVAIDVYITGLKTEDIELFKVGDTASITIRNQPVKPPMQISAVKHWSKQVSFISPDGKKAVAFADPAQPLAHDFLVTVVDQAEVTDDGYVIRGNKIKIGNQVELESFKYRAQGVVVDIHKNSAPKQ